MKTNRIALLRNTRKTDRVRAAAGSRVPFGDWLRGTAPFALLAIMAGMIAMPSWAQTAGELLQKGIYTQETAGDLDGAIAIYRQIVNSGNSPRDVAAQAQYRLAQSLLQKGDLTNGATEFSNLARNYADYGKLISSLAAQARGTNANASAEGELVARIEGVMRRLKAAEDARAASGPPTPDKAMIDEGASLIDRREYDRARLVLNTLVNSYPNSQYLARAKLAIAQSWVLEGGPYGLAQAKAEFNDFTRFYPDLAAAGGRGGRGPAARPVGDLAALEAAIESLKAQEQAATKDLTPEQQAKKAAAMSNLEAERGARNAELLATQGTLTSMTFDANSPVTVKGVFFRLVIVNPNGSICVDPMDGTGKRYTFLTASPVELARQGMTKVSLPMGGQVTVTGVLASGGQTLSDGTIAARADTITTADGRKMFDRALLKGPVAVEPGENEIRLVLSDGNFITLPVRWRQR